MRYRTTLLTSVFLLSGLVIGCDEPAAAPGTGTTPGSGPASPLKGITKGAAKKAKDPSAFKGPEGVVE